MYFQYDTSGAPLGFIYNGTQYFYMTNQMGDVIAINDCNGNVFAQYVYDEWGKCISILPAIEGNETIANANPLRYRGYYLDSETGYYYLQSRYYDPSICRFINSDIAEISQMSKDIPVGTNLFAYCCNDPTNCVDKTGTLAATLTVATFVDIIILALAVIGVVYTATYILKNTNFTPVINAIKDLCKNCYIKTSLALDLIKSTIKTTYKYVKSKIKSVSKAASTALTIATANAKIKAKVKYNSKYRYWNASLNYVEGVPYIIIGSTISYSSAKNRVNVGGNVISVTKSEARTLTNACGGIYTYHSNNQHDGYFPHYHPINNKKVHIWFVF